jgi:uncharacterized protein YbgA (DUF1722 family)
MDQALEHVSIEFHDKARKIFFALFRDFNAAIDNVDRRRDEYMFRDHREKYVNRLQQQLREMATDLINKHHSIHNVGQLSQNLNHYIADYLHQFITKVKEL